MKANLSQRFACLLDPADEKFSPLAAAACFVNPTVCEMLVNVDVADGNIQELLTEAEDYVAQSTLPPNMAERQEDEEDQSAAFRLYGAKEDGAFLTDPLQILMQPLMALVPGGRLTKHHKPG